MFYGFTLLKGYQRISNRHLRLISTIYNRRVAFVYPVPPLLWTSWSRFKSTAPEITPEIRALCDSFLKSFRKETIPKDKLEVTFSRSRGPGGQNVNKAYENVKLLVNTKVDMRLAIQEARWIPEYIREKIKEQNSTRINKKGEWIITSDQYRTQHQNYESCLNMMYEAIVKAAQLPAETSEATKQRIEKLKRVQNEARLEAKKKRSQTKSFRRGERD